MGGPVRSCAGRCHQGVTCNIRESYKANMLQTQTTGVQKLNICPADIIQIWLLVLLVSCLTLGAALDTEVTDEQLRNIQKPTGLDLEVSFRCGAFYFDPKQPPPEEGGLPAHPLVILNATFDASSECPDGNYDRYTTFCQSVWDKVRASVTNLRSPSFSKKRAAEGYTIGRDICEHLKNRLHAPFVGKNSKKFPEGVEFGFYTNACGHEKWTYVGRKHDEKVCCAAAQYQECDGPEQTSP